MFLIAESSPVGVALVTFASIPQGYRDLRLVVTGASLEAATSSIVIIQFNGSGGTAYDYMVLYNSNATTAAAAETLNQAVIWVGDLPGATAPADSGATVDVLINGYAGPFHKSVRARNAVRKTALTAGMTVKETAGFWESTAAITSIAVQVASGAANFATGTRIGLYGIA